MDTTEQRLASYRQALRRHYRQREIMGRMVLQLVGYVGLVGLMVYVLLRM